jgi:hypothetical protein
MLAPLPNSGMADTLDEAKAALAKRYAEGQTRKMTESRLSAEQRRALAMLATAGRNGATQCCSPRTASASP